MSSKPRRQNHIKCETQLGPVLVTLCVLLIYSENTMNAHDLHRMNRDSHLLLCFAKGNKNLRNQELWGSGESLLSVVAIC